MNNNINQECLEISKLLTSQKISSELGFNIDSSKIDYSLDSLIYVDDILKYVHEKKSTFTEDILNKILLRFGCYCGEVIRKELSNYNWLTFDDASKLNSEVENMGKSIFTYYLLYSENSQNYLFPISKVSKYVEHGESDSLYFYSKTILNNEKN